MPDPNEAMIRKLIEDMDSKITGDFTDVITGDVFVPYKHKSDEARRRMERELFKEWDKLGGSTDPIKRLRGEMHDELDQIKAAIRKIGIMLDGDAPTQEQMEKFKMLKEAYTKYKMIEALVLGKEAK